jgi:hypothetical protein
MKIKFRIHKYSHVFNRVTTVYGGLKKFILVDQDVCFPRDIYNFSFVNTEFRIVLSAPISYRIYMIAEDYITIIRRMKIKCLFIMMINQWKHLR